MSVLADTNGYDLGVALVIGLPALIGAIAGLVAAWNSQKAKNSARRTEAEVKSPNGERQGDQVYEIRKQVQGLVTATSEIAAGQQALQRHQLEHQALDEERFGRIFKHLSLDDR